MTSLARPDFTDGLFKLLRETFEEGGRFYLQKGTAHAAIVGREQEVDWPSSWRVHRVGAVEWETLKRSLLSGYEDLMTSLKTLPWGEDSVCDSVAIVAHTAYHLGAIRQIQRWIEADSARNAPPS